MAAPDLGARIPETDRRRARLWRSEFLLVWLLIVAGLVSFVLVTVRLNATFMTSVVPFILGGATTTVFVSFASIIFAIVLAALGALGRLSRNPISTGSRAFTCRSFAAPR